jgi:hypothetical protein
MDADPTGQPQASSLESSTSTGNVGPFMQWVRASPYSLEEIGIVLDALYIVLFGVLFYMEVSG